MTDDVVVCEVGLRDGLQLVDHVLPTAEKLAWIEEEAAAGVQEIEVTSMVPARVMPQFADAEQVVRGALELGGFLATVLVPNLRGAQRAVDLGVRSLDFVMAASETFSQANLRRTPQESLDDFVRIVALCRGLPEGDRPIVKAGIATALGCAFEGAISVDVVRRYAANLAEAGADQILIADTVGYGDPAQVIKVVTAVRAEAGTLPIGVHFHDTRGLGLANVTAALECGVRSFDASLGGLGGCPFAPGATGNIVTEDLCFLLDSMGLHTGIDFERLLEARRIPERNVDPSELRGALVKAGLPINYVSASDRATAGIG